jgi:hypothetical protein
MATPSSLQPPVSSIFMQFCSKEKKHWTPVNILQAEVFWIKWTPVCNLHSNTSKIKMKHADG